MKDKSNASKKTRSSVHLCHEVMHYILREQEARQDAGLHNTKFVDIINDWLLESGQRHGYPAPGKHPHETEFEKVMRTMKDKGEANLTLEAGYNVGKKKP